MIQLNDLKTSYKTKYKVLPVLNGINLNISKGEMISIIGASGSGKTTLLNTLGILSNYDSGEYILNNVLIKNLSEYEAAKYRNKFIGFVFQSFNLISYKNALENVALPLYYQKIGEKKRNIKAMEFLERFGLKEWWYHKPAELSGGQNQRIAIARALITSPLLLLADEPTGALDSLTSNDIMILLRDINKKEQVTMVIVTHDNEIASKTDRAIKLTDGIIETHSI